eukprot:s3241_g10.t2
MTTTTNSSNKLPRQQEASVHRGNRHGSQFRQQVHLLAKWAAGKLHRGFDTAGTEPAEQAAAVRRLLGQIRSMNVEHGSKAEGTEQSIACTSHKL